MASILGFIKTYAVSLLCAVAAVAFIAIGVMGMMSDNVKQDMQDVITQTNANAISGLRTNAQNEETIEAERERGERIAAEVEEVRATVAEINAREPLMEGVLPTPINKTIAIRFREVYARALERLPRGLNAGTLPTEGEIEEERQNVADLIALESEKLVESNLEATRQPPVGGAPQFGGPGAAARAEEISTDDPKFDPVYRARVNKARSIQLYYDGPQTFQSTAVAVESADVPDPRDVWLSQVSLWIQQDVLDAIKAVNDAAAAQVDSEEQASVGDVPIKRLRYIRFRYYIKPDGKTWGPTETYPSGAPRPPAHFGSAFSDQRSNDKYDVVRFVVCLVVDQRDVIKVIDAITRANFYKCVNVSYGAVNRDMARIEEGYFYGPNPVSQIMLEFEGYFLRDVYGPLMPPSVLEELQGGAM